MKEKSESGRVRIVDIANELGVSTATVSNVIQGKTSEFSDETVKRVQNLLEEREYIPSMAGLLLAENDSQIIGIVINDHEKYEGHVIEDPFVGASINSLSKVIEREGYLMMLKVTTDTETVKKFASMWNMVGMVLIGFCEQDYKEIREKIRIPFVVYDGYFDNPGRICNLSIDNYSGGYQAGRQFLSEGHKKMICISDNNTCMDHERYQGFYDCVSNVGRKEADLLIVPVKKDIRRKFYEENFNRLKEYTGFFIVSDYYAVEFMYFMMQKGIRVPEDISVIGFDDSPVCTQVSPSLSSIRQDNDTRAECAVKYLVSLGKHEQEGTNHRLSVKLILRESTK